MKPKTESTTQCLRCGQVCRQGTPDPTKKAIHQATEGFCPDCMVEKFLLSVEPIRSMFQGTEQRPARIGPEIFLDQTRRENLILPVLGRVLSHTQLPVDSINWINVVSNWGMPWPKGREPGMLF